eukprot:6174589-Pleurochrysis_carterae.AAC.2
MGAWRVVLTHFSQRYPKLADIRGAETQARVALRRGFVSEHAVMRQRRVQGEKCFVKYLVLARRTVGTRIDCAYIGRGGYDGEGGTNDEVRDTYTLSCRSSHGEHWVSEPAYSILNQRSIREAIFLNRCVPRDLLGGVQRQCARRHTCTQARVQALAGRDEECVRRL